MANRAWQLTALFFGLFITWLTFTHFLAWGSLPHDENLFQTAPSRIMVVEPVAAKSPESSDSASRLSRLQVGDLVVELEGKTVRSEEDFQAVWQTLAGKRTFSLTVFRAGELKQRSFHLAVPMSGEHFVRTIPPAAVVQLVTRGGASDRAGMKPGDLIVAINGKGFQDAFQADAIMRQTRSGQQVEYRILRANREQTLTLTMARFTIPATVFLLKCCGVLILWAGLAMLALRPGIKAARISGIGMALLGSGIALAVVGPLLTILPLVEAQNLLRWASLFFGTSYLIHSRYYFPSEHPLAASTRMLRAIPHGLAVLGIVLVLAGKGNFGLLLVVLMVVVQIIIGYFLSKSVGKKNSAAARTMNIYEMVAVSCFILMITLFKDGPHLAMVGLPILLIPFSYWYTTLRYQLLDFHGKMPRSVQYSVLSLLWAIIVLGLFLALLVRMPEWQWPGRLPQFNINFNTLEVLDSPSNQAARHAQEKRVLMLLCLVFGAFSWKFARFGQRLLDRKFHRAGYDYRKSVAEFSEILNRQGAVGELGQPLVSKLAELMMVKRVVLMVFQDHRTPLVACSMRPAEELAALQGLGPSLAAASAPFLGEIPVDYLPRTIKEVLRAEGFRLLSPVQSKERLLALVLVGEKLSETPFVQEDFTFLHAASKQISIAIENGLLYQQLAQQERIRHELSIARGIQLSSLPQETPAVNGLSIAATSLPATEVGGDFFDYLPRQDGLCLVVGDVSGKGTSAALYMAKLQGILRCLGEKEIGPAALFRAANSILYRNLDRRTFVTAIACQFDAARHELLLARAGHLPLWAYHPGQGVTHYQPAGMGLGLENLGRFDDTLREQKLPYQIGDVFLLVTDGVTEAFNPAGELFGAERLEDVLSRSAHLTANGILQQLEEELATFAAGTEPNDDLTIVVVKVVP
jgi:serine phosphatase RsbU (regulator of sigma subunit)/membrane-associated protease RseP (regulator of RpoE activity)